MADILEACQAQIDREMAYHPLWKLVRLLISQVTESQKLWVDDAAAYMQTADGTWRIAKDELRRDDVVLYKTGDLKTYGDPLRMLAHTIETQLRVPRIAALERALADVTSGH